MLAKFIEFYRKSDFININEQFLYAVFKSKLFSHAEDGGLIGLSFRISSAGMIFSSDVMTNGGCVVPKNRVLITTDPLDDYLLVCVHLCFVNYFDEYFFRTFRRSGRALPGRRSLTL